MPGGRALTYENVFELIGGLAFFFFGIRMMSDGLRKVSSERLKNILSLVTKRRLTALLVGIGVTVAIQSSSALTVMLVGFVNAGLILLDFVDYLEKRGDHLTNIPQGLLHGLRWESD